MKSENLFEEKNKFDFKGESKLGQKMKRENKQRKTEKKTHRERR